ncbi:MAG: hypothetical protein ACRC7O_17140, partial [Fimbriiglobus sp.]
MIPASVTIAPAAFDVPSARTNPRAGSWATPPRGRSSRCASARPDKVRRCSGWQAHVREVGRRQVVPVAFHLDGVVHVRRQ